MNSALESAKGLPDFVTAGITTRHYLRNIIGNENYQPEDPFCLFERLNKDFALPQKPSWLRQIHSNQVVMNPTPASPHPEADAATTDQPDNVLAILTADCLPVFIACESTHTIALIHAGWRGLAAAIIANTLDCMNYSPQDTHVWLGPAICHQCFEVSEEVYQQFIDSDKTLAPCFQPNAGKKQHFYANLQQIAAHQLKQHQISKIQHSKYCTLEDTQRFYSYRKASITARMVSFMYMRGDHAAFQWGLV